ncbi:HAD family hydrolase [Alkalicoccus halolimnae]|uniref:HAD family hydrolase n=1 Tax=Alkalicoccus halolimnae TaxID=1667239 RepID=A0AAJ8N2U9_9BACI|nr:HAD family hydrolase [Alkalicoccus halolimnae]
MNIKAVFLDMDGTLLKANNTISERTTQVIHELTERGIYVFLATGRHMDITIPYHRQLRLRTPLICLNGSAVYHGYSLDPLQLRTIAPDQKLHRALLKEETRNIILHTAEGLYCTQEDEIIKTWIEEGKRRPLHIGPLSEELPAGILKYSIRSDKFLHLPKHLYKKQCDFIRWNDGFELIRRNVSKWSAVEYALNQYGIKKEEAISFGDGPNDFEMIRGCGTGVAMGNAIAPLKKAADFVTYHHEADGIARFLEEKVLGTPLIKAL